MAEKAYNPEDYWTEVGSRIQEREQGENVIAGDDEPYYRYKRNRFLELLSEVNFENQRVLEIGHGPGGNLQYILSLKSKPTKLAGCDISEQMIKLARKKLPESVELIKINGREIPITPGSFDIVFTATVLQHNTNEQMLFNIIESICKLKAKKVYFFERIENEVTGDDLCLGRPIKYYADVMAKYGYKLNSHKFINIRVSYYLSGTFRKILNKPSRKEGEPLTGISVIMQNITLPITKLLDKIFTSKKDLARMEFVLAE